MPGTYDEAGWLLRSSIAQRRRSARSHAIASAVVTIGASVAATVAAFGEHCPIAMGCSVLAFVSLIYGVIAAMEA